MACVVVIAETNTILKLSDIVTDFSVLRSRRTVTLVTADDIDYTFGVGFKSR